MSLRNKQRSRQSLIGSILIAFGVLVFCANLNRTCVELIRTLYVFPRHALGLVPTLVVAVARLMQDYSANRRCLLHFLILHIVTVVWPLLLVAVGAILSGPGPSRFDNLPSK